MAVFVLDRRKKPLMPCSEKRARIMLGRGRARIHRMASFTIRWMREVEHALVMAVAHPGKKVRTNHVRVAIRASGSFNIQTATGLIQGISHRFRAMIQRADGYGYISTKIALKKGKAGTGAARAARLSLPGRNVWVPRAIG